MATQLDHSKQDVIDDNYIAEQEDNNKNNPHNHNAFDKPLHHIDLATARNIQCVAAANLELNNEYHQRALDQANKSFKYAWITACFAFLLFAVVVVFFMLNFTSLALIGTIGSAITAITSGTSFYLYRKTLSYYDDFHKCLARTELLLLGNSLCLQIHDK